MQLIVYQTGGAVAVWVQWQGQLDRSVTTPADWHFWEAGMHPAGIWCVLLT